MYKYIFAVLILVLSCFVSIDGCLAKDNASSTDSKDLELFEKQLQRTKLNLENASNLLKEGVISQKEFEMLENKYNNARTNFKYVVNADNYVTLAVVDAHPNKEARKNNLAKLKLSYEKMLEFYQKGLIPEADVVEAELNYKATELNYKTLESQLANIPMHTITRLGNPLNTVLRYAYKVITSRYGYRVHPVTGLYSLHSGIDIAAPKNTPVYAYESGTIIKCGEGVLSGKHIVIAHDKTYSSRYLHLNAFAVKQNQVVRKGQLIGYVGTTGRSTGDHLHFELRKNHIAMDINYLIETAFAKK